MLMLKLDNILCKLGFEVCLKDEGILGLCSGRLLQAQRDIQLRNEIEAALGQNDSLFNYEPNNEFYSGDRPPPADGSQPTRNAELGGDLTWYRRLQEKALPTDLGFAGRSRIVERRAANRRSADASSSSREWSSKEWSPREWSLREWSLREWSSRNIASAGRHDDSRQDDSRQDDSRQDDSRQDDSRQQTRTYVQQSSALDGRSRVLLLYLRPTWVGEGQDHLAVERLDPVKETKFQGDLYHKRGPMARRSVGGVWLQGGSGEGKSVEEKLVEGELVEEDLGSEVQPEGPLGIEACYVDTPRASARAESSKGTRKKQRHGSPGAAGKKSSRAKCVRDKKSREDTAFVEYLRYLKPQSELPTWATGPPVVIDLTPDDEDEETPAGNVAGNGARGERKVMRDEVMRVEIMQGEETPASDARADVVAAGQADITVVREITLSSELVVEVVEQTAKEQKAKQQMVEQQMVERQMVEEQAVNRLGGGGWVHLDSGGSLKTWGSKKDLCGTVNTKHIPIHRRRRVSGCERRDESRSGYLGLFDPSVLDGRFATRVSGFQNLRDKLQAEGKCPWSSWGKSDTLLLRGWVMFGMIATLLDEPKESEIRCICSRLPAYFGPLHRQWASVGTGTAHGGALSSADERLIGGALAQFDRSCSANLTKRLFDCKDSADGTCAAATPSGLEGEARELRKTLERVFTLRLILEAVYLPNMDLPPTIKPHARYGSCLVNDLFVFPMTVANFLLDLQDVQIHWAISDMLDIKHTKPCNCHNIIRKRSAKTTKRNKHVDGKVTLIANNARLVKLPEAADPLQRDLTPFEWAAEFYDADILYENISPNSIQVRHLDRASGLVVNRRLQNEAVANDFDSWNFVLVPYNALEHIAHTFDEARVR
ncbi:hypothetical protein GNI_017050 [Gregarina niphandrodes]|uniref:Uncharacterized protein n=1 Tax=Gregarina niphandrodes TaxID=110365 RepID=A0A023BC45_GRENI|nr:hypothetical protein GNI_017050 [Gregarina niphandrodes]EZG82152.1 hypothetical protein GNI_017050 [Gregarina niphandrodes]|eukprot:XP_011129022.1 hypothetical protein GNI_017050 [Gregarina niphandrodes]